MENEIQFDDAVIYIENLEVPEKLEKSREAIEKSLSSLPKDNFEEIGTHYYYLLRVALRRHILFENDIAQEYFRKMLDSFLKQEKEYRKKYSDKKENKEILFIQIGVFYQLMERYFSSLQVIYEKKDFRDAGQKARFQKMSFRKKAHFFRREYLSFLGYKFVEIASGYGTSFFRWGLTSFIFILFFAAIFVFVSEVFSPAIYAENFYDFVHFSTATFTTLGYGDLAPITTLGKLISNIEVFTGYIMLGTFLGMLQQKM